MKISVIIPVYNAELYLDRCINSIINQTYKNLEIILIDDGSIDSSLSIARSYETDSRIKVYHKPNGGQSSARNLGLECSTGDYIAFVDSDDWIALDLYQHVIDILKINNCDVVDYQGEMRYNHEDEPIQSSVNDDVDVIREANIIEDYLYRGQTEQSPFTVWRKVYKSELLANVRFIEDMINEDIVFNFEALQKAKELVHTSKVGYYYYQSPNSTTRDGLKRKDFDLLKATEIIKEKSTNENDRINYLIDIKHARSYFSLLAKIAFYGFSDSSLNENEVINELTKQLRSNFTLLMKSPMPVNRKLMIVLLCIDIKLLQMPLKFYKLLKG